MISFLGGVWNDVRCFDIYSYICERPIPAGKSYYLFAYRSFLLVSTRDIKH